MMKRFPQKGQDISAINKFLAQKIKKVIDYKKGYFFGYPVSAPLKIAVDGYTKFLARNSNNIGTHTRQQQEVNGFLGTIELEREAVGLVADIFKAKSDDDYDGYISSGGTEGNIMGMWILRNFAKTVHNSEPFFLTTKLAHYSVEKTFNLLKIVHYDNVEVNENFEMDPLDLEKKIRLIQAKGFKNFAIVCVLGHTITGSVDPVWEINSLANKLKKELGVNIFIHLDASFGGFIYPFLSKNKVGFDLENVMTITTDGHKTGLIPYSCGIFLCRKNLQRFIELIQDIVQSHHDDTLLGSRSGAVAAALWAGLMSQGRQGYKKIYLGCIKNKLFLLNELNKAKINFWHYTNEFMNVAAIEFSDFPDFKLPYEIEEKHELTLSKIYQKEKTRQVYKFIIMPHVKKSALKKFVEQVKKKAKSL